MRLCLSAGQVADVRLASRLTSGIDFCTIVADKGYDSDALRAEWRADNPARTIVIPYRKNRRQQQAIDRELYKQRNTIERMFNRLKHYRRIATRYEKIAEHFLAFVLLAATMIRLS